MITTAPADDVAPVDFETAQELLVAALATFFEGAYDDGDLDGIGEADDAPVTDRKVA